MREEEDLEKERREVELRYEKLLVEEIIDGEEW